MPEGIEFAEEGLEERGWVLLRTKCGGGVLLRTGCGGSAEDRVWRRER